MLTLVVVGLLGGLITSISPCVLPVLPIVLAGGLTSPASAAAELTSDGSDAAREGTVATARRLRVRRPLAIVAGLVLSFSATTLFGSWFLGSVGLPQDLLRNVGIGVLMVLGLGLLVPWVGDLLERPFVRLRGPSVDPNGSGLGLGLGLGLVFAPCAGPVLATIAVVGATHRFGFGAIVLTLAFAVGAALPLLAFALAGERMAQRLTALRAHAQTVRRVSGVVMVVIAVALAFSWTDPFQRGVPGYTAALQNHLEDNSTFRDDLRELVDRSPDDAPGSQVRSGYPAPPSTPDLVPCSASSPVLVNCGPAPEVRGIAAWHNTPGDAPRTLAGLRGRVVLIDFWTYSCINCQRTLPHLQAWYRAYHDAGLEIIGVHSPEFAFERVDSNVVSAARKLGVEYPIAIDNDFDTWDAYGNQYWPAKYLVDATGEVRSVHFGEGEYDVTETLIRELLTAADPTRVLPPRTDLPDATPDGEQTPETYVGYLRARPVSGTALAPDATQDYPDPAPVAPDTFGLSGTWTVGAEHATAGPNAELELNFQARTVFLVLGGTGDVTVTVDGQSRVVRVRDEPTLYTLVDRPDAARSTLTLGFSPGVEAYAFTFG